jgi:hypothetical protein
MHHIIDLQKYINIIYHLNLHTQYARLNISLFIVNNFMSSMTAFNIVCPSQVIPGDRNKHNQSHNHNICIHIFILQKKKTNTMLQEFQNIS